MGKQIHQYDLYLSVKSLTKSTSNTIFNDTYIIFGVGFGWISFMYGTDFKMCVSKLNTIILLKKSFQIF